MSSLLGSKSHFMRMQEFLPKIMPTTVLTVFFAVGCVHVANDGGRTLAGAWRGKVQFRSGAFAETKNLEFMYVFNVGGTMTESSNYDGAPPVPPAYGTWRKVGERKYEAKYAYFWTKAPASLEELSKGGGWSPGGHGLLTQQITLADDGGSFVSMIKYEVFDQAGKPTEKESVGDAQATRITF